MNLPIGGFMTNNTFVKMAIKATESLDYSIRYLASQSGYSHAQISYVFQGKKKVSSDFCISVSRAVNINPVNGLVMAGIIKPEELQQACEEVEA